MTDSPDPNWQLRQLVPRTRDHAPRKNSYAALIGYAKIIKAGTGL
jgi:hypothetical protein